MSLYISYHWDSYMPEQAWHPGLAEQVPVAGKSTDGYTFWPARPGATLAAVADWMSENGLVVTDIKLLRSTRQGHHWAGLYKARIEPRPRQH